MYQPEPIPLGPGSLLWRYAGDNRLGFTGLSAGILQLMHPGLGAGVVDHSDFFNDPWGRVERSMPEIIGVVYDGPDAEATGARVRGYHRGIKGTDPTGRAYSALKPETFWYAHATFQYAVEQLVDRFDSHTLTPTEREQLYREGIEWYRRYGVSSAPVPPTRAELQERWDHYCADVLELTTAAERAVDMALHSKISDLPGLPSWTGIIQREVATPILRLTAIGGLPSIVRRRFDIPWGTADALQLSLLERVVRDTWRFVPRRARWAPRASAGWRREVEAARRGHERAA
jgi:uncharacterized protein (DUF2236 family)